jgi:hypothetical protein
MVSQTLQVCMVIYSLLRVVCAKIVNITALASEKETRSPHTMLVIFTNEFNVLLTVYHRDVIS